MLDQASSRYQIYSLFGNSRVIPINWGHADLASSRESHEGLGQVAFTLMESERGTAPGGPPSKFIGFKMARDSWRLPIGWKMIPSYVKRAFTGSQTVSL